MTASGTIERALSPAARERRRVRTPVLGVTALAWLVTAGAPLVRSGPTQHGDDSMGMAMSTPSSTHPMHHVSTGLSAGALPGFLGMWLLMVTAMMSPLLVGPLRHLGARSLPRRRAVASVLFLAAYAAVWSAGGVLLLAMTDFLDRLGPGAAIALGVAGSWQFSPVKQRCLNGHHRRPSLAAFGRQADLAALRFGARHGAWCVGSCWAAMLLPLLVTTAQTAVMAAVTLWIWAEQLEFPSSATWRVRIPTRVLLIARAAATRLLRPEADASMSA